MKFKYNLYHYQEDVLNVFKNEIKRWEKKIHIVAPPGSWKTIMWIEMISRLKWNHLILVPNITLQYQWEDKIKQFFLEDGEDINDIVSTSVNQIKKINILTYQSLTTSDRDNDLIMDKILDIWFLDIKDEFNSKQEFLNYVETLKNIDIYKYKEKISKYKKKLKIWKEDLVEKILSKKVLNYFQELEKSNIKSIIVDEAHHLTNWWSKVIYFLWEWLSSPLIIWLTATPPYDDIDFFILDDDYSKLLWEVDYYIPTPAVVKSARLSPWSDLVYFVEPWNDLKDVLEKTDKKLNEFILKNKDNIIKYIFSIIKKEYDSMLNKSYLVLINYLKFIKNYSDIDIGSYYFDEKIWEDILLEDIAKTIGKYLSFIETKRVSKDNIEFIETTKKLFYELWYIWRKNNFYKFRTQIENMLIYSKSKIKPVKTILDKEINNLWKNLKCAIITDYLEDRNWIINCKYILKELKAYKNLNPILVSWQWICRLSNNWELEEIDTNILEVTRDLEEWKVNLVIWTRWMLGEWWDCPKLNTLIDLTWIVAYMSVNQVRWRAIRLDKSNPNKVSNIYDIVTYYDWYTKEVDLYRLERKHEKFYWVDDTWLIIRWVNHIYPNIRNNIADYKKINQNMLKRSSLRDYYYKLWQIWWNYKNKETFGLDLEVKDIWKIIPFINFRINDSILFFKMLEKWDKLINLNKNNYYYELIRRFLDNFISVIVKTQIKLWILNKDFKFEIKLSSNWNFKLISNYKDELMVKIFILDISTIFSTIINQKYLLKYPFSYYDWDNIKEFFVYLWLPDSLSRNKKSRDIFRKELKNNILWYNSFFNIPFFTDKITKLSLIWWTSALLFFISPITATIVPILSPIWIWFFFFPTFYKKRNYIIKQYKVLFNKFISWKHYLFRIKFIYLKNRNDIKWEKPFIESKIEKIWL